MGQTIQTGNTSITGTVSATVSEATYTTVAITSGAITSATTTTLGTVPANKVWKIIAIMIQAGAKVGYTHAGTVKLNAVVFASINVVTDTASSTADNVSIVFPYSVAPTIAAGQTVTYVTTGAHANASGQATVVYIEESV